MHTVPARGAKPDRSERALSTARGNHVASPPFAAGLRGHCAAMTNIEEQLAAIGFGRSRGHAECWHAVRLHRKAPPTPVAHIGLEPTCSRALLRWRDVLASSPRPSPYRISRA